MLSKVKCVSFKGLEVIDIDVEVSVTNRGLPGFEIVGLPNKSIEESKYRIKTAFINSGVAFPEHKIVVNLAPADVIKTGSFYDLSIAAGVFCAVNNINQKGLVDTYFFGELSLDGSVRQTSGLYLVYSHVNSSGGVLVAPLQQSAAVVDLSCMDLRSPKNLSELFDHISGSHIIPKVDLKSVIAAQQHTQVIGDTFASLNDVIGQDFAKRGLEIAVAGGHNILLTGSPGTGKSLLARSVMSIIPQPTPIELHEIMQIYAISSSTNPPKATRPFRNPHHTISFSGMLGGGAPPLPGEITLSHNGVLFMDEFCEFSRNVLEALRQPMQDGSILITRNNVTYKYPSKFLLIAASNPCPCGYYGHKRKQCICTQQKISAYQKKLSGPLADRFDLFADMYPDANFLERVDSGTDANALNALKERILLARAQQTTRFKDSLLLCNNDMTNKETRLFCILDKATQTFFDTAFNRLGLSPRAYFKLLKVSRTIADLSGEINIRLAHVAEALQYRKRL